jgi:hypothetical protein
VAAKKESVEHEAKVSQLLRQVEKSGFCGMMVA